MYQFSDLCAELESYLPKEQIAEIASAYALAEELHSGQTRSSGEPYISHPVEVARILCAMRMDAQSIIAAILHDVLEDTELAKSEIEVRFGSEIADIVDGLSKLAQIKFENKQIAQAENFRKMMLAMTKDIRVILIKLADRLHNIRTLDHLPKDKQRRIAKETLEIYAPISLRLGMHRFKEEFETTGFKHLYPVRYRVIKQAVQKAYGNRKELLQQIENNMQLRLAQEGFIEAKVEGRQKQVYSLYKKMLAKGRPLNEIMDVYGFRILVDSADDCYRILGVVHSIYKPVPGRFKDYIALPKNNGYQALHTTVLGPHALPVEIQIRTNAMHQLAENGIAAHWLYKTPGSSNAESRAREWLKSILEIQQTSGNSLEFIEQVKVDLYPKEVYVFTPQGDILSLPYGATVVDFAYLVHTDVGNSCIAAKVDRRLSPLSTRLKSGQTVEVITAQGAHPNPQWLSFVATHKARANIRNWLRSQQQSESEELGKRLLNRSLQQLQQSIEEVPQKNIKSLLKELKMDNLAILYQEIGLGNLLAPLIARRLVNILNEHELGELPSQPLAIMGTEGMVVSYAKCCRPIPWDPIIGFLSTGRGIVIHRDHCKNLQDIDNHPEKLIYVAWSDNVKGEFQVELKVDVVNKRGVLATLANTLAEQDSNIENIRMEEKDSRHNTIIFIANVKNRQHLARLIRKIRVLDLVTKVSRSKG